MSALAALSLLLAGCVTPEVVTAPPIVLTAAPVLQTVVVEQVVVETQVVRETQVVEVTAVPATFSCEGKTMAYLSFGSSIAYIAIVDNSMRRAAEEYGVELVFLDNEFKPEKALENAELIAGRSDIDLVFEFNYYQSMNNQLADIFAAGNKPVIAIDIPVPGSPYYGANNYLAGKVAGQGLADWSRTQWPGEPVDLVLVEQQSITGGAGTLIEERTLGIIAGIQAGLPDLPVENIVRVEGGVNVDQAGEAIASALSAHPEAERILIGMLGDSNAVAAANAAGEAGRDVGVAGIGADDVAITALRTGEPANYIGTTTFFPEHYGDDLIPMGCDLLAGKQIPAQLYIDHTFMTRDNLNDFYPE
jgi:ribose transport system substrate-binding protein